MARILLVDDDPDFVESVTMILEKKGHAVIPAYDGVECMEKVKTVKPDAIILDVMMPNKDGYEVCKELKRDPAYQNIPILLLTAVVSHIPTTTYTYRDGMETEADDYVDKPVEPAELVRLIERLIQKK
jgi:two-component system alkaline phosphatase synthesis response regulator PhoP